MGTDADSLRARLSDAIIATDPAIRERLLTDPGAYLDLIAVTAHARAEADTLLRLAVAGARAAGCTWESVGGVLGMSKQAAQQRYGTTDDDAAPNPADPPVAASAPDDPAARTHQISWLNAFTEMRALDNAARYGWHLVGSGPGTVVVRKSDVQWEHQRVLASRAAGRALEVQGWTRVGSSWFPHAYYKRPTGQPALPEPSDDGYLGRS